MSFGTPPNKGTQKEFLTNLLKTSCSKSESLLRKNKNNFRKCSSRYVQCSFKTLGKPFNPSEKKFITNNRTSFKNFFCQIVQRTCRMELWHTLQNLSSKARRICRHFPRTSSTIFLFGRLQCRFHNLPENSFQTPLFVEKKVLKMCFRTCILQF